MKEKAPSKTRELPNRFFPLVILGLSILIYLPSIKHGFVWDDWSIIFEQTRKLSGVSIYKPTSIYYRPVTTLTFILDQMLWKASPLGYHLTNILLNALNTWILFLLIKSILVIKIKEKTASLCAMMAAVLFATYPIHVESVSWIAGRTDLVATLFILLTFFSYHLYRVTREPKGLVPTLIFFLMALGSKETGVMVLPLILLWEIFVAPSLYGNREKKAVFITLFMGAGLLLYMASRLPGIESYTGGTMTISPPILLKALGFYIRYLLLPFPILSYIPNIPRGTWYLTSGTLALLIPFAGTVLMPRLAWWVRGMLFSYLMSVLAILPSLALIVLGIGATPLALRYLYLPSAFFCLGIAFALAPIAETKGVPTLAMGAGTALLIFALAPLTLDAQTVWRDELTFWQEAVKLAPNRAIPHNQYGLALASKGKIKQAQVEFEKALRAPDIQAYPWEKSKIYTNLGRAYLQLEKPRLALKALDSALKLDPGAKSPYCVKARAYLTIYKTQKDKRLVYEAYHCLKNCISRNPTPGDILLTARLALYLKNKKDAQKLIKILVERFPESKEARQFMGPGSPKHP